jgi:Flp pilus assembly protein TadD
MLYTCASCGATNRDDAKFCDQCGALMDVEAAGSAASAPAPKVVPAAVVSTPRPKTNWVAVAVLLVILGGVGWLLFMPKSNDAGGAMGDASGGNPHGNQDMNQMMAQIQANKDALAKDPLDTQALAALYQTFSMVNRQDQVRTYLEKALEALDQQKATLGDEAKRKASDIAMAAINGNDLEGALLALGALRKITPEDVSLIAMMGDLNYDLGKPEKAIEYYDEYLSQADASKAGDNYWKVRVDRASMLISMGAKDAIVLDQAMQELLTITAAKPEMFNAWFNLGVAYVQKGDKDTALKTFEKCKPLAQGEMQTWQVDVQLARLKGEPEPPMPASPHGEGMGEAGGGGMANPHGGMDMGGGGDMANPHGGMDMGDGGGMANPHGG